MKKFLLSALALVPFMGFAEAYTTAGNGTAYNLQALSAIEGSNVTLESEGVYVLNETVTIAAGDSFTLESGVTLKMADAAEMVVYGAVQMDCATATTITRVNEEAKPYGIKIAPDAAIDPVHVNNVKFDGAGLRFLFDEEINGKAYIADCEFTNVPKRYSAVLHVGSSACDFEVLRCRFVNNEAPAIMSAANYFCGLLIDQCYFEDNNTLNSLNPQLNLTVGLDRDVIVRNCTLVGVQRAKVGGIAVANMLCTEGQNNVLIEGNTVTGHSYGVTTYYNMNAVIKNNTIVDNKYVANAMSGGSGISIYDYKQNVWVEGNTIEDNYWGITLINVAQDGSSGVYNFGKVEDPNAEDYNPGNNKFNNNGNGGVLYDFYNNGPHTVYAQGNVWGVEEQTEEQIETVITHKNDNEALGQVIFMPAGEENGIEGVEAENAPVEYFNLQGMKVANPENGLFIKKQGKTATKVVL